MAPKTTTMKKIFLSLFIAAFILSATNIHAALGTSKKDTASVVDEKAKVEFENAVAEFKSLSKKERKLRIKEAKSTLKDYKADKKAGIVNAESDDKVLLIILAVLLPPLAVYLHENAFNGKFWLSLLLTLLFVLPGIIYALLVVLDKA